MTPSKPSSRRWTFLTTRSPSRAAYSSPPPSRRSWPPRPRPLPPAIRDLNAMARLLCSAASGLHAVADAVTLSRAAKRSARFGPSDTSAVGPRFPPPPPMGRRHHHLVQLLLILLAGAVATNGANAQAACEPTNLATQIALFCAARMPTAPCCASIMASDDLGGGVPCLCRVAAQT